MFRRIFNNAIRLGLFCIIVGGIMGVVGMSALGWDFYALDTTEITRKSTEISAVVNKISVDCPDVRVRIVASDDAQVISVDYYEAERDGKVVRRFDISESGGVLKVRDITRLKWYEYFDIMFFQLKEQREEIRITVPSGDVFEIYGDIDNGRLTVSGVLASVIDVEADNGIIALYNVSAQNAVKAECDNGKIVLENVVSAQGIYLAAENGRIEFAGTVSAPIIKAEVDNGVISGGVIDAMQLELECDNGKIDVRLFGQKDDYTVSVSLENGSSNIGSSNPLGATRSLRVRAENGKIVVRLTL